MKVINLWGNAASSKKYKTTIAIVGLVLIADWLDFGLFLPKTRFSS